jgi:hypothetical protein
MNASDLREWLERSRRKTLELLDSLEKLPDPASALGWRPGPGRAHIAWQLMHLGATDDRHLNVRMKGGEPCEPEYVRRFAGGSTPDDEMPPLTEIRSYLGDRRDALLAHLAGLSDAALAEKPNPQAPWVYREWFQVLAWHEAHHHGQAHLTLNLYRAAHGG